MKCIFCGEKSLVKDVANHRKDVYRRRKCASCGAIFYTMEKMIPSTDETMKKAFYDKDTPEQRAKRFLKWYYKDKAKRESSNDLENNN